MELPQFKKIIDKHLQEFLDLKIGNFSNTTNKELYDILLHLKKISKEGKRIRPYVAYLSYKASGGNDDISAIKFLTFIEVFHLFCLIHDDIIDQADKRHNTKTIHKYISEKSNERYGDSQAILVGDLVLSWSLELTQNDLFPSKINKNIQSIFFKMVDEVILGQMLDLSLKNKKSALNEEILQKMLLKTAGYSFTNPFIIGAALAGVNDDDFYKELGTCLGLAFQMQDDLLDIVGIEIGKTLFNDVSENQPTLITNYILENGTIEQKEILKKMFGNILNEDEKLRLRKTFEDSGAIEFAQREIDLNIDKAREIINEQKNPKNNLFLDLVKLIGNRKN